jgi:hypothetical protein
MADAPRDHASQISTGCNGAGICRKAENSKIARI